MPKKQELVGFVKDKLTVLSQHSANKGRYTWLCKCECGGEIILSSRKIVEQTRTPRTCGCLVRGVEKGISQHPLYFLHKSMHQRCQDKNLKWYGMKGVKVCEEWKDLHKFSEDMGERPSLKHTIDRIDPNGDYEPGNCRWATWKEQAVNKTSSPFPGQTVKEVLSSMGIKSGTFYARIESGWTYEEAISVKVGEKNIEKIKRDALARIERKERRKAEKLAALKTEALERGW